MDISRRLILQELLYEWRDMSRFNLECFPSIDQKTLRLNRDLLEMLDRLLGEGLFDEVADRKPKLLRSQRSKAVFPLNAFSLESLG